MKKFLLGALLASAVGSFNGLAEDFLIFKGTTGPGLGKHIVFLTGDEEYRSEEGLTQLAQILSERQGFKCTVLFAIDPRNGQVNPDIRTNLPGAEALDSADLVVMLLRFREWPDAQMKHFVDFYLAGKPIVALRTSTHAFNYERNAGPYSQFSWQSKKWMGGFGKQVLGETWVSHHGEHKKEATRGVIEGANASDAILQGIKDVFANSDVYTANPPSDAKILLRGAVLAGMEPGNSPVAGPKNAPMQPVAWTRLHRNEAGKTNKVFCTTLGAATDLLSEDLRRLIVNAVYWGMEMKVPARADVGLVGNYHPTMYGFGGFVKGRRPADFVSAGQGSKQKSSEPGLSGGQKSFAAFELHPEDHIALIGNALPDRFQHSGWLEAMLHTRLPDYHLVFRNLAVAGDEVSTRHRPENFGSPDEWLARVKADVVFAFFGFNESFAGPAGKQKFEADLTRFIQNTKAANYSGKGGPRLVLFSPIANEHHRDPDFADPQSNNVNLKEYTEVMRKVAGSSEVTFVDLFDASRKLYQQVAGEGESLTINGFLLSDRGDRLLGKEIAEKLMGPAVRSDRSDDNLADRLLKLREAVNEKNEQWHARYRTVDGNNVYGGRSALAYQPEKGGFISDRNAEAPYVSNYKVMQEEMSQRDVLTANRDRKVWAAAKGESYQVDDSNLPAVTKIKTNLKGSNADESFPFIGGEEAIGKMKVHSGMKVNLFASEEQFPELAKPVQMAWDTRGRLWVATWPNYPERTPDSKVGDSLLIFEDTDGDGKADKCTHFADDLNAPTGFQFYKDGVLLVQAPDLWFLRDTNGDGKADFKERVLMGLSSADSHHTANALCLDPGGAVYLSDGVFHRTQVETATGPVRNNDAAIYRYEPRTARFETYVAYNFANPHGRVFDYWGNDLITDATGNNTYFGPAFSGHIDYPSKHVALNEFWNRPSRPCPGTGLISSRHFPEEFQGNFLDCNVIGFQGIYRVKVSPDGSGLKGETLESLVSSTDPSFRPSAVSCGPDGAIYFCDWQTPIIGHMQHHLRDPNRDHAHGRIYRITYEGRKMLKPSMIEGRPVEALLDLLKEPENLTRELAKIELGKRDSHQVLAALESWVTALDSADPRYEHHLLEALWVHQWHNAPDSGLLRRLMKAHDSQARAAAARVLCYWRDRIPESLKMFVALADDSDPRVRLEAVRAASFYSSAEPIEIILHAQKQASDYYLNYTMGETMKQLLPFWRKNLESPSPIALDWDKPEAQAGLHFLFGFFTTKELLALPHTPLVQQAVLRRVDVSDLDRMVVLAELAKVRNQDQSALLVNLLDEGSLPTKASAATHGSVAIARLVPFQNPDSLKPFRDQLLRFAKNDASPDVRANAWAGIALVEGSFEPILRQAAAAKAGLADVLEAITLTPLPDLRITGFSPTKEILGAKARPQLSSPPIHRAALRAIVTMGHDPGEVFSLVVDSLEQGNEVPTAARALRTIPRQKWPQSRAADGANAILAWAKQVSATNRNTEEFSQVIQVEEDLITYLPAEKMEAARGQLRELRVPLFVIHSVREQMRYDTPRVVVEAGRPFEIIFENADFMPHNLLISRPGTRDKLGTAAALMKPDETDAEGRVYVPKSSDVIASTKLLLSGQRQSLSLTASKEEGDNDFFCTFPGHYQVMWGKLIITKNVDEYFRNHREPVQPGVEASAGPAHHHGVNHNN